MGERNRIAELHDATRGLIEADSEVEILDVAVATVDRVLGFGTNVIRKADHEMGSLSAVARSETSRTLIGDLPAYELDGESAAVSAYRTKETVIDEHGDDDEYGREPMVASLYVPLGDYGVLAIGTQAEPFSETDVELAEILGSNITASLKRNARERAIRNLHSAFQQLTRAESEREICEIAIDAGYELLGFPLTTVLLYDPDADKLEPIAATEPVVDLVPELPSISPDRGIIGRAYQTGEIEAHDDVREDPAIVNSETRIRSEIVVPLGDHGVLIFDSAEVGAFDGEAQLLVRILGANVEAALDRNERDQQLREHVREIERKNDRLEMFASVLSHDLRNPLNLAQGYLEIAREEHDSDALASIADAHERMDALIEDVLTLARQGRDIGTPEAIPLTVVVRQAWSSVETPESELVSADLPTIRADESRLHQLFENLFRNAIEHAGPDVTVRVGPLENGFFVADDGPGIPKHEREHIFERGYTAEDGGTGLGLPIVKTVVDAHGWSIEVTESRRGGARFEITDVELVD